MKGQSVRLLDVCMNETFIKTICQGARYLSNISAPFPIYFMAVAEIAESINTRGSLRELPEGERFLTQPLNSHFFVPLFFFKGRLLYLRISLGQFFNISPLLPNLISFFVRSQEKEVWVFQGRLQALLERLEAFPRSL